MATTKLKDGETVTLPFEEMIRYVSENKDHIEGVEPKNPTPKRKPLKGNQNQVGWHCPKIK